MQTFFMYVGEIIAVLIGIAIAMAIFALALANLDALIDKWRMRVEENWRRKIGRDLVRASSWLSEDPSAYIAVEVFGKQLAEGEGIDESTAREIWRTRKKLYKTRSVE